VASAAPFFTIRKNIMDTMKAKTKPKAKAKKKDLQDINGLYLMTKPSGADIKVSIDSVEHALSIGWKYQ
tara:strand:+ start:227 stop:433 length:207 start_codon:yes stop_codon:yes gene_type:complete